jgi:hypothetical protein
MHLFPHFRESLREFITDPKPISKLPSRARHSHGSAIAVEMALAILCIAALLPAARAEDPKSPTDNDDIVGPYLPGLPIFSPRTIISLPTGTSFQVNVSGAGQNIGGDAANEATMCIDPNNPNRIAIAWRQFDSTNSNFRQAGYAYSINGGVNWTVGGTLQTNVFRSDPVLASDAEGRFYYLSLNNPNTFSCDIWRSTNGGANWQLIGPATGGDKEWLTIDTTPGPGHGNIYQDWDTSSPTGNRDFTLSRDGGVTWSNPIVIPQTPYFGTLDVGPSGELYLLGWNGSQFWVNRSTNAPNPLATFAFDLTVAVNLGGNQQFSTGPNPVGLLGQASIGVDRSSGPTRGNVYALCSAGSASSLCDVMFARSTNRGVTWSAPVRINDAGPNSYHWFGTLAVAPNGRIDVCWYDTRSNTNNNLSQLYYSSSSDGGLTWSANQPVSLAFNTTLGWPQQQKIGDYLGLVALSNATCIAYSATYNGEEDIYFLRIPDLPIRVSISMAGTNVSLSWNAIVGNSYCLQYKSDITAPWPIGTNQICVLATNQVMTVLDSLLMGQTERFYRVATSAYGGTGPRIVSQPVPQTNYASLTASLSVYALGQLPLTYQWRKGGVDVPGATQSSLPFNPLSTNDAASYTVVVSNATAFVESAPAALTVLPVPTSSPDIPGLVLHLTFDNDLTDATGRGNNGTGIHVTSTLSNVASPTFVTGMVGAALHYSSDFGVYPCCTTTNTSYVTLGVRPDLQFGSNVNFSVAYWIRLPAGYSQGDLPFFCDAINSTFNPGFTFAPTYGANSTGGPGTTSGGWALSLYDAARANGFGVYGDAGSINDGNWHHLVHIFDRTNGMVTYLDGQAASFDNMGGATVVRTSVDTGLPAVIGQDPTGQYPESGSADMDDLGVWRRALTSLEAASIYLSAASNHLSFTGSGP